ncbi:MAG: 4-hydroxy-tetrahydrodipicolinate reductase [Candidatus Omnitrophota bacterium]
MIRLAMIGAAGRMGRTILRLASEDAGIRITGAIERRGHPDLGKDLGELTGGKASGIRLSDQMDRVLKNADVAIDFTHASAVESNLKQVTAAKVPCVIGTTGLPETALKAVKAAARKIAIVQSPNMSIGVNLLLGLTDLAARVLDESYDAEIAEIHHRGKKDSPSGTAMKLLEVIAAARGRSLDKDTVFGRKGDVGVRPKGKLGVLALRGGDVIGDHTVFFLGDGERIELAHKASSRDAFAKGALRAAKFVFRRPNGLFTMRQVLGMDRV